MKGIAIVTIFQSILVLVAGNGWGWQPMQFGGYNDKFPSGNGRQVPPGSCCYCIRPGCDVSNYPAYKRIPGVSSEDQCMSSCGGEPNNYCKAAVLNQQTQSCDLFERPGDQFPASLNYRPGSAYYAYCKDCDCPNYKIVPCGGGGGSCPGGQTAFLIRSENVIPTFPASGQPFTVSDENQCRDLCRQQKDGSGGNAQCVSAVFNSQSKQCAFYADKAANKPQPPPLQQQPGVVLFETLCLPADLAAKCQNAPNQLLQAFPRKFLGGHVSEELNQPTLEACMLECIRKGPQCKSADYFYGATPNCLLQTESRNTRPDVWIDQEQTPVTYFDNNCERANLQVVAERA